MASVMVVLSASTTAALHWFTSPYVHHLSWEKGSQEMDIKILSWMSTPLKVVVNTTDIRQAETQRPLVTFEAKGRYFYVDVDAVADERLRRCLVPWEFPRTYRV
eukprot:TRINITY_DN3241_c0_g2_i4.p1 TRINITY_DN3241_c0_g2~~TRINITY_DN3241_c0_g2_i4.p1  ORF type:complete len:104 (+),score=13.33 TRINITY_DN3241_c0_g2_i4:356-667(+)